jgi:uncharacterized protein YndB with AHSA1/START domain
MSETKDREIVQKRIFNAPRELVFRAFTERAHIDHWFGPAGFKTTTHQMDVRPGGVWRFTMQHPEQGTFSNKVAYLEITPPERLVRRASV